MSARRLIIVLFCLAIVALAAVLAIDAVERQALDGFGARLQSAEERGNGLADLRAASNAYGWQAAEVMLLGRSRLDQLGTARIGVERALAHLAQATKAEFSTLAGIAQVQDQLPDVDAARHLTEIYHSIDAATNSALGQQRAGNSADALQLYTGTIAFRLSNELQPIIDAEATKESAEIDALRASRGATQNTALAAQLAVAVVALLALIAAAVGLARAHRRQVAAETRRWQEASARLQNVDEQRAHFLADISHQLRTPLTILRGEADVALRGRPEPAELRAALERVQLQAVELGALLEDIMTYARSDAESRSHEPVDLRLDDVVAAALVEGQTLAEAREVTIEAQYNDQNRRLTADPRQLRQALLIGLDNAIKHTAPGGRIELATALGDQAITIRILDNGPGIDPEEKPRLFERFYRGKGEADLVNQGSGIGLAIARDIVSRHGGTIDLSNRKEGGAVLEITLPLPEVPR